MPAVKDVTIRFQPGQKWIALPLAPELSGVDVGVLQDACEYLLKLFADAGLRRPRTARFFPVQEDVFAGSRPLYPRLLSEAVELELSSSELLAELLFVLSLRDPDDRFAGPYIYSVLVRQPENLRAKLEKHYPDNSASTVAEGYLYHDFLYVQHVTQIFEALLVDLDVRGEVEITLSRIRGLPD